VKVLELDFFKHREGQWYAEYRCGCSVAKFVKNQVPAYCMKHGESKKHSPIKVCKTTELSLAI
jgi:hypothetical protein